MHDRKAKSPTEVSIKRAANGGFIVRHSYDNYGAGESYQPPREHAFTSHAEAMAHVKKHTSGPVDAGDQKPAPTKAAGLNAARTRGAGVD